MNICLKSLLVLGLATLAPCSATAWTDKLPDGAKIRELSIPGAHDAATGCGFASGSDFLAMFSGVTQALDIDGQWEAGIRAFDLRPAYNADAEDCLQIYHGILQTKLSLRGALDVMVRKLDEQPREFAIILMRHENDSDNNDSRWADAVSGLLNEYDSHIAAFAPGMTVDDARGKIIVLSRDRFDSAKAGIISGWNHSENFSDQCNGDIALGRNHARLYVQDFYECKTAERKTAAVNTMLDYSILNTTAADWVINHASGYTGSTGTNSNVLNLAKELNPAIAAYLDANDTKGRTGIVMMDFAGTDSYNRSDVGGKTLTDRIIAQNALYLTYTTSVDRIEAECDNCAVYNLQGICVGHGHDCLRSLPAGTYICAGRKFIIR